ncbi:MAG: hypothetical protein ABEJ06_06525 [Haloarculaceae archaeon]
MEEAAAVRRAAEDAVADVDPEALRGAITSVVGGGSTTPGVLTLLCARAAGGSPDAEALIERAAGVQLIYDGLRLTRTLSHDPPWERGEKASGDMTVLAADVLVARGFYLLARTEAAGIAVGVVRAFGRDQTTRREADDPLAVDANLERDVLDLAVHAGATAAGTNPAPAHEFVADVAPVTGDLPSPESLVTDGAVETLRRLFGDVDRDEVQTSVD